MGLSQEEKAARRAERKAKRDAEVEQNISVPSANTDMLTRLVDIVSEINARLTKLEENTKLGSTAMKEVEQSTVATTVDPVIAVPGQSPIPLEYRQIVDDVLNYKFGIRVIPSSSLPMFEFGLLVPKEYSNGSQAHWDTYKEDYRPKQITYIEGVAMVKLWVDKVADNLGPEIRARIQADKIAAGK